MRGEGENWERYRDFQIRKYRSSHSANTSSPRRRLYVRRRMLEDGKDTPSSSCFLGVAVPADDGVFCCGWSVGGFSARFRIVSDISMFVMML